MRLLAYLPQIALARLRLILSPEDAIDSVSDPFFFFKQMEKGGWDLILVEPEMVNDTESPEFLRRLSKCSRPIIFYTALSRVSASAIASISAHCLAGVVLRGYDDSPDLLRNALAKVPLEFFGAQMVERLGSRVDALPTSLSRATTAAFCSTKLMRSATEYAALSGMSRRSVDRWLRRVGLSPSKWIVGAAQFLRAYPLVQSPAVPFIAVSRASGYGSVRSLRLNALALTGNELDYLRTHTAKVNIINLVEGALRI